MGLIVGLREPAPQPPFQVSKSPFVIGRLARCDVCIDSTQVSRRHAQILQEDGRFYLEDLDSTNFVFLNRELIAKSALAHGDIFNIGGAADFIFLEHPDEERVRDARQKVEEDPEYSPAAYSMRRAVSALAHEVRADTMRAAASGETEPTPTHPLRDFEKLQSVSYLLNSSQRLSQVLSLFLETMLDSFGARRGFILLVTPRTKRLEVRFARSAGGEIKPAGDGDFSRQLVERAVELREPVLCPPLDGDETKPDPDDDRLRDEDLGHPIMALPLCVRNTTIGGLYIDRDREAERFTRRERIFAEAICHQAAIAVDNARLHETLREKQAELQRSAKEAEDKNLKLAILNEKLDQKVAELSALNAVSRGVNMISTLDEVLKLILEKTMELVGVEKGSIMLVSEETGHLEVKTLLGVAHEEPHDRQSRLRIGDGIAGLALKQGVPIAISDGHQNKQFKRLGVTDDMIRNLLCVPLILNNRRIGVINLTNRLNGRSFTENDKIVVTTMANQAAITIENARLYNLAVFDGLTHLHVPRFFHVCLQNELTRCRRYDTQLSLVLADLDHFKKVNDIYGHPVGDLVLQNFSQILKETKRSIDIAARYGGEEFAVILPETDIEGAKVFAERLRVATEAASVQIRDRAIVTTVSIGIANFPTARVKTRGQLISLADRALYRAKAAGRNAIEISGADEPMPAPETETETPFPFA